MTNLVARRLFCLDRSSSRQYGASHPRTSLPCSSMKVRQSPSKDASHSTGGPWPRWLTAKSSSPKRGQKDPRETGLCRRSSTAKQSFAQQAHRLALIYTVVQQKTVCCQASGVWGALISRSVDQLIVVASQRGGTPTRASIESHWQSPAMAKTAVWRGLVTTRRRSSE